MHHSISYGRVFLNKTIKCSECLASRAYNLLMHFISFSDGIVIVHEMDQCGSVVLMFNNKGI